MKFRLLLFGHEICDKTIIYLQVSMKNHRPIFLLLVLILLAACGQTSKTLPAQATTQPTEALAKGTAKAIEGTRVGITVISPSTWSPTPSSTPAIIQPTITPNPDTWITEQAYERTATQIASFPATCDQFNFNDILFSPNGTWMAIHCGYSRNQTLEVNSREGKQWIFHFKDYIAPNFIHDGETGLGGLYPVHWTSNDEYLYFTSYIGFDGGGTCFYGFGVSGLFRLNVNTGAVSTILAENSSPEGYEIAFSPGGGKLAYIADRPVILDFRTGEKESIDPGAVVTGDLVWSPDGSKLAFSTCSLSEDVYTIEKSGVKIYSLETHELKTIVEVEKNFLSIDKYKGNQKLAIVDTNTLSGKYEYIYFDWSTGQLSTPTPTRQP